MNLEKKRPFPVFLLALVFSLVTPVLFPRFVLLFYSPLIILYFYLRPLHICLWIAFACGFIEDCFSSEQRFGVHALNYCLTVCCLYNCKKNFFADSQSTLPIMVFLFSLLSTVFHLMLGHIMGVDLLLSVRWGISDLFLMPLLDSLYSYIFFILPSLFFYGRPRKGSDYFMSNQTS
jgi:rod shape-determining protein MreD